MIYLDYNATTPIAPEILEAMMPYLTTEWGNPSSSYSFGSKLKGAIAAAREQVADLINASPLEITFTSCATESNNTAIQSALLNNPTKRHIITSQVEHSSVLNHCRFLERQGYEVTYLPVDHEGLLKLSDLENAITPNTAIVSLMWANNETGVLFPVAEIGALCRSRGIPFHCDGVQAVGKLPINLKECPIDYLSLSGHKFCAPKGIGALYIHRKARIIPYLHGGHQERGRRGGTENVPQIVGMGQAASLATKQLPRYVKEVTVLRNQLEAQIIAEIPNVQLNGHKVERLPNTTSITFSGVNSEALLLLLDRAGICTSSGSACLADSDEPSHVIKAMMPEKSNNRDVIRFSMGYLSKKSEIEKAIIILKSIISSLKCT
jgi:cysteine desulfurase